VKEEEKNEGETDGGLKRIGKGSIQSEDRQLSLVSTVAKKVHEAIPLSERNLIRPLDFLVEGQTGQMQHGKTSTMFSPWF
jgi:hypothetical protein